MSETINDTNTKMTFSKLRSQLRFVRLPDKNWCYTQGNETFFGFQRVEEDRRVIKRVAVFRDNFEVRIYLHEKLMPFSAFIKIDSVDEIGDLLKVVHDLNDDASF